MDGMGSRMRLETLRMASSPQDVAAASDVLLAHHEWPDEPNLLCKMLVHPDAGVGERALAELAALHAKGKLALTGTMRDALVAFQPRCREPNALDALKSLLA